MLEPERRRDLLLILLGFTTGATDATAFERLGHVFASVITGNVVLLGVAAAKPDGKLALFAGCALAGYACGVFAAAPRSAPPAEETPLWPAGTTVALLGELALLIAFAVGWELAGNHPAEAAQALLLAAAAAAMGVQSTAVRRLGQMSTTYLTSTLTGLVEALAVMRWSEDHLRSVGILLMLVAGAVAAVLLVDHARAAVPALQLIPLGIVVAAAPAGVLGDNS